MWFRNILKSLVLGSSTRRCKYRPSRFGLRLRLEPLEERRLLAFDLVTDYGADLAPQVMVSADFNGDGRPDLVTANTNTLSVLLGNGDGTFQPAITSAAGYNTMSMRAADLNADGKTDLVTVSDNYGFDVRLGNGNGTFQPSLALGLASQWRPAFYDYPQLTQLVPQSPTSVSIGDLNADGHLDLIAGGEIFYYITYNEGMDPYYESFANVLLGNGDGTFRSGIVNGNGSARPVLDVGDSNNDGRLDVLADGGLLLGNGDGTLRELVYTGVRNLLTSNPVNDFNGDGNLDVLSGAGLYLGNGDGSFQPREFLDLIGQSYSTAGDVNGDGNLDVVLMKSDVTHFVDEWDNIYDSITTRSALVLLGNGNRTFAQPIAVDFGTIHGISSFTSALLADFDGNGSPDLATSESFAADVYSTPTYRGLYVALNDGTWVAPPPSITLNDVTVTEGNTGTRSATFTVTLSAASMQAVAVTFVTANGTASAGSDYAAGLGTLTFAPGDVTKTITVLVTGDRLPEPNETFFVNLSNPTNATITDNQGVGTIVDDEPRVSVGDVSKKEGRKGQTTLFTFTVTLSSAYDQSVTMSYKTVDGTAKTSDGDYVGKTGTLTFAPGETTKTITIEVKGDSKKESDETFYLDLFGLSSNALFTKNRGIGKILNDD